jgi:hypothetical protein
MTQESSKQREAASMYNEGHLIVFVTKITNIVIQLNPYNLSVNEVLLRAFARQP